LLLAFFPKGGSPHPQIPTQTEKLFLALIATLELYTSPQSIKPNISSNTTRIKITRQ